MSNTSKNTKKTFQAETKELLDLMINSIYTNKDIFLRELISNASDAIDKLKFKALTDTTVLGDDKDYKITLTVDKDKREITIADNGIGMTYDEVDTNIGTIAKSGSKAFKESLKNAKDVDIIGQFGVGFYAAFMVADNVSFVTKSNDSHKAVHWESSGDGSYTIEEVDADTPKRGTVITLHIKDGEDYNKYLEEWQIESLVKKYSDYIKYPIHFKDDVINSTKPLWKQKASDIKDEDYDKFYQSNFHDYQAPFKHYLFNVQGNVEYTAMVFIPSKAPMDYYSRDYKKGLQLYTKNVFIMDKCEELIPDYLGFVHGLVECDSLSLNISREILQQNKDISDVAKSLEKKILGELTTLLKNNRDDYVKFWEEFGNNIKIGVQSYFGLNKDKLQDLLIFRSSNDGNYVTLREYVDRMGDKKEILYVSGDDAKSLETMPKVTALKEKGVEVLYFTDRIDEFAIKALRDYDGKQFKSINDSDFKLDDSKEHEDQIKKAQEENKTLIEHVKEFLGDKVSEVTLSNDIGNVASAILAKGEISLEMEKVLSAMPGHEGIKAEKIFAINPDSAMFSKLQAGHEKSDHEYCHKVIGVLYNEALLMEGMAIDNIAGFVQNLNELMAEK